MKRLALLVTLVCAVAGSVAIASALAGTPNPVAQSLNFACGVEDANGNIFITTQSSDTLYANGKEQLHCVGIGPGNGTYIVRTGFACGLVFTGVSFDPNNKETVSKSGEAQLTCFNDDYSTPASSASMGAQ
jgi:hypothetical protein